MQSMEPEKLKKIQRRVLIREPIREHWRELSYCGGDAFADACLEIISGDLEGAIVYASTLQLPREKTRVDLGEDQWVELKRRARVLSSIACMFEVFDAIQTMTTEDMRAKILQTALVLRGQDPAKADQILADIDLMYTGEDGLTEVLSA